jgi:hypothetical protein
VGAQGSLLFLSILFGCNIKGIDYSSLLNAVVTFMF